MHLYYLSVCSVRRANIAYRKDFHSHLAIVELAISAPSKVTFKTRLIWTFLLQETQDGVRALRVTTVLKAPRCRSSAPQAPSQTN